MQKIKFKVVNSQTTSTDLIESFLWWCNVILRWNDNAKQYDHNILQMLLHNPVETPKIADFSFAITPGEESRVIVRPRISSANPAIISIPQRKRKCFFTTERKLRYYRTYTQRNCILECEANFTQQLCACVQYYMPSNYH